MQKNKSKLKFRLLRNDIKTKMPVQKHSAIFYKKQLNVLYIITRDVLISTPPIISANQCTPETILAATIKTVKIVINIKIQIFTVLLSKFLYFFVKFHLKDYLGLRIFLFCFFICLLVFFAFIKPDN